MIGPLRLATRGSPLARWQARRVAGLLEASGTAATLVVVETIGDRRTDVPLDRLGGQGVFVKEVQAAVVRGEADAAVHSAKDLPAVGGADRARTGAGGHARSGPIPATRWSGVRSTPSPSERWWPPARPGGGRSWPTSVPT